MSKKEVMVNDAGIRLANGMKVRDCDPRSNHRSGVIFGFWVSPDRGMQAMIDWDTTRTAVSINRIHTAARRRTGVLLVGESDG